MNEKLPLAGEAAPFEATTCSAPGEPANAPPVAPAGPMLAIIATSPLSLKLTTLGNVKKVPPPGAGSPLTATLVTAPPGEPIKITWF